MRKSFYFLLLGKPAYLVYRQFGNVLVLAAVHNSTNPEISRLVPEHDLRRLLDRTISFIGMSANISPVLAEDANILRTIRTKLFPDATSTDVSFSDYPSI